MTNKTQLRLPKFLSNMLASAGFAAALSAVPAAAQSDWVNPEVIELRERLQQIESQLAGGFGGASTPGAPGASRDMFVRLNAIETELRRVIGQLERIEFEQRRADDEMKRRLDDFNFRLLALEEASAGSVAGLDPNSLDAPSAEGGAFAAQPPITEGQQPPFDATAAFPPQAAPVEQPGSAAPVAAAPDVSTPPASSPIGAPETTLGSIPGGSGGAQAYEGVNASAPQQLSGVSSPEAETAFNRAVEALRAGAFDGAEQQFIGFINAFPSDPKVADAKYWIGETHFVRGQNDLAAKAFLDAFRTYPNSPKAPDSLMRLGVTLAKMGQTDEACLTFSEVPARYPNAPANLLRRTDSEARRAGCR